MKGKSNADKLEAFRGEIAKCVRCGACSTVCPSFLADRRESHSPRGRMALIEAVLDKKLKVSDVYKDRLATCAGCLACESACASGVPFSRVIQAAKEQAVREAGTGLLEGLAAAALKRPALMRSLAWLVPVAMHYSIENIRGQGSGVKGQGRSLPASPRPRVSASGPKGKVAFFPGCAVRFFQPDIGIAVGTVLDALGYDVVVPEGLQCCGRPFLSLGDREQAVGLAKENADVLSRLDVEAIVTACASCGLTFKKDYPELLGDDAKVRVLDIHEFLEGKLDGLDLDNMDEKVTWHDPCHLTRGQGLGKTARRVLCSVPGVDLVEMKHPDKCCGFGGVMRLTHADLSGAIGEVVAREAAATGTGTVVTGCPGCRMQIADALRRNGAEARVVHTVQVIAEALGDRSREPGVRRKRGVLLNSGS